MFYVKRPELYTVAAALVCESVFVTDNADIRLNVSFIICSQIDCK